MRVPCEINQDPHIMSVKLFGVNHAAQSMICMRLRFIHSFNQEANNIKSAKRLEVGAYYKSWMLYVQIAKREHQHGKKKYVTSVQPQGREPCQANVSTSISLISLSPQ